MIRAYLSLGTNLGDREANLRHALERLASPRLRVTRVSPLYETEPQDLPDQPWFLNLVAEAETSWFPKQLLRTALAVEREMGRVRGVPKGPRVIDIDVLLYGGQRIRSARLTVPHPRMLARRFVLEPLADLAPDLRHPGTKRAIAEHLAKLRGQAVRRV